MRRYPTSEFKIVPYSRLDREEKYDKFVEVKFKEEKPVPASSAQVIKSSNIALSSLAVGGAADPRGFTEEARKWAREVHRKDEAEKDFWGKAPVSEKLWNDPEVPDSAFAADYNISKKARVDKWR